MGQVIAFPAPPTPYPDLTVDLDTAERVLLVALRWWIESCRKGDDPIPRLYQELQTAGAPDAAFPIDAVMTVVARGVIRPIDIHCPRCPHLSVDEKHLLRAASFAQAGESQLAEKVLRTTLLSAQGADFTVGPLEGLGELFRQARLLLRRRRLPGDDHETADNRESAPPASSIEHPPGITR